MPVHSSPIILIYVILPFIGLIPNSFAVQIKSLSVPARVINGSTTSVILDCDYILEEPLLRAGVVVKWFFNDQPDPVYQWIHSQKPQDLGVLKGRLNLDYRASEDEAKAYRALEIINPTTSLSGEYKCLVSTFANEDSRSKKMVVYVPERSLTMTLVKPEEGKVTVRCVAEGVYPEPKLSVQAKNREGIGSAEMETVARQDVYDMIATVTYPIKELETPTTFDCILRIPEANYTVTKSTIFYPDEDDETNTSSVTEHSKNLPRAKHYSTSSAEEDNGARAPLPSGWLLPTISLLYLIKL